MGRLTEKASGKSEIKQKVYYVLALSENCCEKSVEGALLIRERVQKQRLPKVSFATFLHNRVAEIDSGHTAQSSEVAAGGERQSGQHEMPSRTMAIANRLFCVYL